MHHIEPPKASMACTSTPTIQGMTVEDPFNLLLIIERVYCKVYGECVNKAVIVDLCAFPYLISTLCFRGREKPFIKNMFIYPVAF